jgi:hypothetical protein
MALVDVEEYGVTSPDELPAALVPAVGDGEY